MDSNTRRQFLRAGGLCGLGATLSGCLRLANTEESTEQSTTAADATATPGETTQPDDTETPMATEERTETETYPTSLTEQWRQFFEPVGPPLVTDERVFVPTRDQGVTAVTVDGEIDWQTVVAVGYVPWHRPALHGGDLYLSAFEDNVGLFRLDAETGTVADSRSVGPSGGSVAATDDGLVVGTDHNEGSDYEEQLFGFDPSDLGQFWSKTARSTYRGGTGYEGTAFVGFGNKLEARNPSTGSVQWSVDHYALESPIVHDGAVYLVTEDGGTRILARYDPTTGETTWTHESGTDDTIYVRASSPAFAEGAAYLASEGALYAIDAATGERQWSSEIGGPVGESPAVVGGIVWVVPTTDEGRNRELLGFDAGDGTKMYHDTLLAETVRPLAFGDALVVQLENQLAAFAVDRA
jgi:outer membrane protein assembly factor BamB